MIQLNGSLSILPHNNHVNKIIKTNHSLNNSFSFDERSNELNANTNHRNGSTSKLNLLKQNQMNRSNSVDIATNNRRITNLNNNTQQQQMKKSTDLTTHTLIELHKFLKDKQIYTNPSDNFKRRTIVLIRSSTKKPITPLNTTKHKHGTNIQDINNGEFGFHLQTYGLVNSTTKQTEFICFVNNVQANSPAQQSGLNNGDVILAIDGICINEFKSLNQIMLHVRNKQELRLVIMCENICKKIQLKQRYTKLKQMINDKKLELERITKQEEIILKKFQSPIEINHSNCFISPNKIENSNDIIKNSTPNDQMLSSTTSTSSNSSSSSSSLAVTPNGKKIPAIIAAVMAKSDHNISRSSPNGTARIQVETFTSPLAIPSTSSSVISFEETPSSSDAYKHASFSSFNKPELLFLKQTPRMSRSALSSSMSFLTKLNNNFKATPKLATQFTNPPMNRLEISDPDLLMRAAKASSLENSITDHAVYNPENSTDSDPDVKIKIVNYVSLSDSFTPALSSLSSSITSSSLSSSSSISPNLSLTNSVIDKSFNSSNEIDRAIGCGIGTAANHTDKSIDSNNNQHNILIMPIFKYSSDNYVITRL